jgi:hypothetical protein
VLAGAVFWQAGRRLIHDSLLNMTKLLEEAVEELRSLPEDEQDRAAEALFAFARERAD